MDRPTPEEANKNGYFGLVEDTQFSVDRGFFDLPFELVISTVTPDAFILYTTDGQGHSLEVIQPAAAASDVFSDKATWQASSLEGGTPGF